MVEGSVLDGIFLALSHAVRRDMLRRLTEAELSVGELAAPLSMSFAAASKHVAVLERAGLIHRSVVGRRHVLRLAPGPLVTAHAWFGFHERYWTSRLQSPEAVEQLMAPR